MTTPQRRQRRPAGENRQRLLEAGLTEFGLFGYHGTATAAVAARADVPQPHVYVNFSTKLDLFAACCALACERLGVAEGDEARDLTNSLMLFQAVAVLADDSLRGALYEPIAKLRVARGEEAVEAWLRLATIALLARI